MESSSNISFNGYQAELNADAAPQEKVASSEKDVLTPDQKTAPPATPTSKTDSPTPQPPKEGQEKSKPKPKKRRRLILTGLGVLAVVAGVFGFRWWQYASCHQSTDDTYVIGHPHPIHSRINGTVSAVLVDDNQLVQKGQLLVRLDSRDNQVQVGQSQALLAVAQRLAVAAVSNIDLASGSALGNMQQARGNVSSASASISTSLAAVKTAQAAVPAAQASLAQANANLQKAQADYIRYQTLYQEGVAPRQQLDTYRATYLVDLAQKHSAIEGVAQAQANLAQALENVTKAQAELAASKGGLQQAKATRIQTQVNRGEYETVKAAISLAQEYLKNAQLQLEYTNIYAPAAGRVGNKTVQVGQRVQPGTSLMSVVESYDWVVANFKETQMENMHRGQPVEIHIDSFPHHPFIGYVDSFSPASGAAFALLPSDNATGNFTKIVQRIPVKIVFDPKSIKGYESLIVPGMSVEASVQVK